MAEDCQFGESNNFNLAPFAQSRESLAHSAWRALLASLPLYPKCRFIGSGLYCADIKETRCLAMHWENGYISKKKDIAFFDRLDQAFPFFSR